RIRASGFDDLLGADEYHRGGHLLHHLDDRRASVRKVRHRRGDPKRTHRNQPGIHALHGEAHSKPRACSRITSVFRLAAVLSLVVASPGDSSDSEVRQVADWYLRALTGSGDDRARGLLLGGVTMDAEIFTLDSAKVVSKEPVRREEGDLQTAAALMRELDQAGRRARAKLLNTDTHSSGMRVVELSRAEASRLLEPTREKADKFLRTYPVLSAMARVGKEIYWHPKNPI